VAECSRSTMAAKFDSWPARGSVCPCVSPAGR